MIAMEAIGEKNYGCSLYTNFFSIIVLLKTFICLHVQ